MKNYKFTIHGRQYEVEIQSVEDQIVKLNLNGTAYEVKVDKEIKQTKTPKLVRPAVVHTADEAKLPQKTSAGAEIKSPLPGTVLEVMVKEGDAIKKGQKLMVLEAMKMENNIEADHDGVVKQIKAGKGSAVMEGDVLFVLE